MPTAISISSSRRWAVPITRPKPLQTTSSCSSGTAASTSVRTSRFLSTIDVGTESIPAFGDIDGDGDLDLLIGNKLDPRKQSTGRLFVFRNNGTTQQPLFRLADTLDLASSFHYAPALADLDTDGDLDLVLGTWNQGVQIYRNEGSPKEPRWQQDTTATVTLTRGSNATPALVDIDADGDLDLFVGEASGELNFYRNTGTSKSFRYELVSDAYEAIDVGRRSHPAFFDFDGDGDLDLISGQEAGGSVYFRNNGSRTAPKFVSDSTVVAPLPVLGSPVIIDLNGDRQPELISGGSAGGLYFFRFVHAETNLVIRSLQVQPHWLRCGSQPSATCCCPRQYHSLRIRQCDS